MSRFTAIPTIPQSGVDYWQSQTFSALKENIELLAGTGTELDGASRAITKGQINVESAPTQNLTRVTASGQGYTISDVTVPSLDDYAKLISDVQTLAGDVANLRGTVNALINQLRG
jgi:hypothetical protein